MPFVTDLKLVRLFSVFLLSLSGYCQPASAESSHGYTRREGIVTGDERSGVAYVQMQAMLAPVKRRANSLSTVKSPVTLIITLKDVADVHPFCKLSPRITDALVIDWSTQPLTLSYLFDPEKLTARVFRLEKTQEQKTIDAHLVSVINKSVENDPVVDLLVIKGARSLGGGAISKLPFSSIKGCIEVIRDEEKKEKSLEEKPEHSSQ